jgi:hypothetical protein
MTATAPQLIPARRCCCGSNAYGFPATCVVHGGAMHPANQDQLHADALAEDAARDAEDAWNRARAHCLESACSADADR